MELDNIGDRDLNVENERDYEEVDYESSQDLQDRGLIKLSREKIQTQKNVVDESKKNRQEDFRRKLRPQGDGTMMDKAKELTNKKNRNTKETKSTKGAATRD